MQRSAQCEPLMDVRDSRTSKLKDGRRPDPVLDPDSGGASVDVLVCPSCSRRYAVASSGEYGGWRCSNCSTELQTEQNDVPRLDLLGPQARLRIDDGHLHRLDSPGDAALGS
jgi:hypothetical protein